MRFYLASRYSRREQLCSVRNELERMGHQVTSRWLETEWVNRPTEGSAAPPEYRAKYAVIDLEDVAAADVMVNFTEAPIPNAGRGGRHVEFGYALALGKRLIVVGHRENLFHEHPAVEFFESQWAMVRAIAAEDDERRKSR